MKWFQKVALVALALVGSYGPSPEMASACSCVIWTDRQTLELVRVEALDGGELATEEAFWPADAELVYQSGEASLHADHVEIALMEVEP